MERCEKGKSLTDTCTYTQLIKQRGNVAAGLCMKEVRTYRNKADIFCPCIKSFVISLTAAGKAVLKKRCVCKHTVRSAVLSSGCILLPWGKLGVFVL